MKKCVIIPDSYKETMSSHEICDIISAKILEYYPDCEIISLPASDGGEGMIDCLQESWHGERVYLSSVDALGRELECFYLRHGDMALIESAQCIGLALIDRDKRDPRLTSSYGVGLVIKHAIERGCREIFLTLGGSSTNDAGAGIAAALGADFYNGAGERFIPTGGTLAQVERFDLSLLRETLCSCRITGLCDVDNPMYGKRGAAYVFAPQKGADKAAVEELDNNLRSFAAVIQRELSLDVAALPGSGAAGAIGAGIIAFLGGDLTSGAEAFLAAVDYADKVKGADLVITGEGRIDSQSYDGKIISHVARIAREQGVPVVAIVGDIGNQAELCYEIGVSAIFSINRRALPFAEARLHCRADLAATVDSLLRFYRLNRD